ncbi:MAG: 30S ribosome-binding factor RbfA [Deltaproteobacteria bacterium]|nr:30S ribosome-binding factor RbfA [Deltaproteobacteria bacterium]
MKGRGDRHARVAERIREEVCLILQHKVKDPGLAAATVTEVTVTPDLRAARISWSVLGGERERDKAAAGWRRCAGFIRREVGRELDLRHTPELTFRYDDSYEKDARIRALLDEIGTDEPCAE